MDNFEIITLRLKQALQLKTDKQIAEALGLSQRAWVGRKKSGRFPEEELFALKGKSPELNLDVEYILHGDAMQQYVGAIALSAANQKVLLRMWQMLGLDESMLLTIRETCQSGDPEWETFLRFALQHKNLLKTKGSKHER